MSAPTPETVLADWRSHARVAHRQFTGCIVRRTVSLGGHCTSRRAAYVGRMAYFVYLLADHATPSRVRYVGVTSDVKRRLQEHARRGPCRRWVRDMRDVGRRPHVVTIGPFSMSAEARCEEFRQVQKHRRCGGADLNGLVFAPSAMHREIAAQCANDTTFEQRTRRFVA